MLFAWLLGRRPAPGQQKLQQQHCRLRRQHQQHLQQHQKSGRRRVAGTLASALKVHRTRLLLVVAGLLGRAVVSASVVLNVRWALYAHNVMHDPPHSNPLVIFEDEWGRSEWRGETVVREKIK